MKRVILSLICLIASNIAMTTSYAEGFTLSSPDISGQLSHAQVFNSFGCSGENISPQLNWQNAPKGTKSFALTVYDPDAPTGSGWWHWVVFDIPVDVRSLATNAGNIKAAVAPKGSIQSRTSFGSEGFGGACPPQGDAPHQYIFTIHALKIESLGLKADAIAELVGFYLGQNTLAKASVVAYYGR
ncbi:MAG: YbhB/YbcL family Raf kinase inhibitor-like protein [Candidatus Polarisedimenticolaceae bacterium]|nr:YbhB/YbcL family Raf kinase inhibitor-like protein [Candidatus Polarisedimenticolaceae bacterium]